MLNIEKIRNQFPILKTMMHNKPLIYLDNSATTQKPQAVINAMAQYYHNDNANVHRGVYQLCERATAEFEATRDKVKNFINAKKREEIIFTKGTTDAINLVAFCFGEKYLHSGDEILISAMEHHSNIVPWQLLCERKHAKLKIIPVLDDGSLDLTSYKKLLTEKVKLVAVSHISNVLGTINPIKEMARLAHEKHIPILIDGAQGIAHTKLDMQDLDCDFYCFSAHKVYGPTGVGVLYGKQNYLEAMPPYQGGGDMIAKVTFEKTDYNVLPYKFEAGTPAIAEVIGLGAALDFLQQFNFAEITEYEHELMLYATQQLKTIPGLTIIGDNEHKTAAISFVMKAAHAHDVATILDNEGVAIRAGHHCAMPLMSRFNVSATARVSFGIYNTKQEIDLLIAGLKKVNALFS